MPPTQQLINSDPFCDVDVMPLEETQGKYVVVRLKDPETKEFKPIENRGAIHSRDYRLVPNTLINQLTQDILTKTGMPFELLGQASGSTHHTVWDGKKFARRWILNQVQHDEALGPLMLGVEAVNSYDGSYKVGLQFFFVHTQCINQFHTGNLMGSFIFSHFDRGDGTLEQDIDHAIQAVGEQAQSFASILPRLRQLVKPLGNDNQDSLRAFLMVRGELAAENPAWPQSYDSDVLDELNNAGVTARLNLPQRSVPDGRRTYWDLLNAYSAVTTHRVGGFRGATLSRMVTDRFVARMPAWAEAK